MALYKWKGGAEMSMIPETTFGAVKIEERAHLQAMLRDNIDVVSPGLMVLAEEFRDWEDSNRRIDLLCLDTDANLVVVELKTAEGGGHMDLQAIRYAAMVSEMTFAQAVSAHAGYLKERQRDGDPEQAILDFLNWPEADPEDFGKEVHILLVSPSFSPEITTAVLWLSQQGLIIRCIRLTPYQSDEGVLLNSEQIIPLPEEEDYRVSIREKTFEERRTRSVRRERRLKFWTQLLPRAKEKTALHSRNRPGQSHYIAANAGMPGLTFAYSHSRQGIQAELYIDTGDKDKNKRLFDEFIKDRSEIETAYGKDLTWERLEEKRASRISTGSLGNNGYMEEESKWVEIQDEWIATMIQLEAALRPHIEKLKT